VTFLTFRTSSLNCKIILLEYEMMILTVDDDDSDNIVIIVVIKPHQCRNTDCHCLPAVIRE